MPAFSGARGANRGWEQLLISKGHRDLRNIACSGKKLPLQSLFAAMSRHPSESLVIHPALCCSAPSKGKIAAAQLHVVMGCSHHHGMSGRRCTRCLCCGTSPCTKHHLISYKHPSCSQEQLHNSHAPCADPARHFTVNKGRLTEVLWYEPHKIPPIQAGCETAAPAAHGVCEALVVAADV